MFGHMLYFTPTQLDLREKRRYRALPEDFVRLDGRKLRDAKWPK